MRPTLRLVLFVSLTVFSCATREAPAGKTVLMRSETGSVVLLPLNVARPEPSMLEGAGGGVDAMLAAYLGAHDTRFAALDPPVARALWAGSVREAVEREERAGFAEAARILVARLSRQSDFDAVIFPSLFVQGAVVSGRSARWDGVEQVVAIDEGAWAGHLDEATSFGGAVPAASLHVVVLDDEGRTLHERQAGLVLLAGVRLSGRVELGSPSFEMVPLEDPLAEREGVLRGIALAFDPFLTPIPPDRIEEP